MYYSEYGPGHSHALCEIIHAVPQRTLSHHCAACQRNPHDVVGNKHWRRHCRAIALRSHGGINDVEYEPTSARFFGWSKTFLAGVIVGIGIKYVWG